MSEITIKNHERTESLKDFSIRLINGENGKMLVDKYQKIIDTVTPAETMQVLDGLLSEGIPNETVKGFVGKIINVF
jgi:DUF438 domain-containing protein